MSRIPPNPSLIDISRTRGVAYSLALSFLSSCAQRASRIRTPFSSCFREKLSSPNISPFLSETYHRLHHSWHYSTFFPLSLTKSTCFSNHRTKLWVFRTKYFAPTRNVTRNGHLNSTFDSRPFMVSLTQQSRLVCTHKSHHAGLTLTSTPLPSAAPTCI